MILTFNFVISCNIDVCIMNKSHTDRQILNVSNFIIKTNVDAISSNSLITELRGQERPLNYIFSSHREAF